MSNKKIRMYKSVDEINVAERIRNAQITEPAIVDSGGLTEFWAEIKRQGEALRAKSAIIPRNHVWENKEGKK